MDSIYIKADEGNEQMITFMMQTLSGISGTGNTYNDMEQAPSHSTHNTLKKQTSLMGGRPSDSWWAQVIVT